MRHKAGRGIVIGMSLLGLAMAGCGSRAAEGNKPEESAVESSRDAIAAEAESALNASEQAEDGKSAEAEAVLNEKTVLKTAVMTEKSDGDQEQKTSPGEETRKVEVPSNGAVIRMENPSWDYYSAAGALSTVPAAAPLKLIKLTEQANQITDTDEWFERNQLSMDMAVTGGKTERYNCDIISGPDRGEAYRIMITDTETGNYYTLDFEDYRLANDFKQDDADFADQKIRYAQVKDGILYFSMGHLTYAETSPHNAYVAAVDLSDQKLLWKSRPLVSNAGNFVITGDVLLCGYGFTAEPDYLYQLDLSTGQVIAQLPLKSKADYLILKDQVLYVRTYNTDYTFQVQ